MSETKVSVLLGAPDEIRQDGTGAGKVFYWGIASRGSFPAIGYIRFKVDETVEDVRFARRADDMLAPKDGRVVFPLIAAIDECVDARTLILRPLFAIRVGLYSQELDRKLALDVLEDYCVLAGGLAGSRVRHNVGYASRIIFTVPAEHPWPSLTSGCQEVRGVPGLLETCPIMIVSGIPIQILPYPAISTGGGTGWPTVQHASRHGALRGRAAVPGNPGVVFEEVRMTLAAGAQLKKQKQNRILLVQASDLIHVGVKNTEDINSMADEDVDARISDLAAVALKSRLSWNMERMRFEQASSD